MFLLGVWPSDASVGKCCCILFQVCFCQHVSCSKSHLIIFCIMLILLQSFCPCNCSGLSGLFWVALGCSGLLWVALACFGACACSGLLWAALGFFGLLWVVLGCFGVSDFLVRYCSQHSNVRGPFQHTCKDGCYGTN